jgi:hypothetical protein
VTALMAWIILAIFYCQTRMRGAMAAHCVGPGAILVMLLLALFSVVTEQSWRGLPEPGQVLWLVAVGCFASSIVGFPSSVVQMVIRAFRDRRR